MNSKNCLALLNRVIPLPKGFYYGVDEQDTLKITLFKEDLNTINKMGQVVEEFIIDDYSTEELEDFRKELEEYLV